jgi:hypothetical protein
VKGLVDSENISNNSDYDHNLSASSPIPPPSENNDTLEYEKVRKRSAPISMESRHLITADKYNDDNESDPVHRYFDSANDIDNRVDLSPIHDRIKKRRNDSYHCDNPTLQQKPRLHRYPSESHVSSLFSLSSFYSF